MTLGDFIKRHRFNLGLTLQEVAEFTGITLTAIWNIENNIQKPYQRTIKKLSKVLKFDETEVFKTYY